MNNIIDIKSYTPKTDEKYLFDANIWIYMCCPIANSRRETTLTYDGFLKKVLNCNATIYATSLVLSEVINRWLRIDFNLSRNFGMRYNNFKDYRSSSRYNHTIQGLISAVSNRVLKMSSLMGDCAEYIDISTILDNMKYVDFNDSYYHCLAKRENLVIVTHDGDFGKLDSGISILTANNRLLD